MVCVKKTDTFTVPPLYIDLTTSNLLVHINHGFISRFKQIKYSIQMPSWVLSLAMLLLEQMTKTVLERIINFWDTFYSRTSLSLRNFLKMQSLSSETESLISIPTTNFSIK